MKDAGNSPLEQVRAASARLSASAEAAIASMSGHDLASVVYNFSPESSQSFSLISGVWVESFPGIRLNLVDDEKHCGGCPAAKRCETTSRVLMETKGRVEIPAHYHDFHETIHVIHGSIQDLLKPDDHPLRRGSDVIYFPAGQMHQPVFEGLFLVCWSPPLLRVPLKSL